MPDEVGPPGRESTTQGIAPGVGSLSNPGELLVRSGPNELTLAEKLRDGFVPGSGVGVVPGNRRPPSAVDLSEEEMRAFGDVEYKAPRFVPEILDEHEDRWIVPRESMNYPVTVDRELDQAAYRDLAGWALPKTTRRCWTICPKQSVSGSMG